MGCRMKLALTLTSLAALTLSLPGFAKTCIDEMGLGREYAEDQFFQPMRMPGGPYKGECLDTRERRNVKLFSVKDVTLLRRYGVTMKKGYTYFANFKHKNKYYIAEYPNNSIANSYLVFEKFVELGGKSMEEADVERAMTGIVLTGHIQLRFKMKKDRYLRLYPQHKSFGGVKKVNDFAYAMFAVRPLSTSGEKFDPLGDGIFNGYTISQNFMSTYDVALAYRDYVAKKTQVGQYKIENSHFDSEKALQALLQQANKEYNLKTPRYYHTWTRNCVTETYGGIDKAAKGQSLGSRIGGLVAGIIRPSKTLGTLGREWNPMFVLANLERRGIIKPRQQSEIMTLNREVCYILSDRDLGDMRRFCH